MRKVFTIAAIIFLLSMHNGSVAHATDGQNGTTLSETINVTPIFQKIFDWTIQKSVTPNNWNLFIGDTGTSNYTVTVTKDNGTTTASLSGQICVTNGGSEDTQGLSITANVAMPPDQTIVASSPVDVSSEPIIPAGQTHCYNYIVSLASPVAGATYKVTADTTILNHSGSLGTPKGPNESATTVLAGSPTLVNDTIHVNDTNGQSWTFSANGSQQYPKTFACSAVGDTTYNNTATITETSQSSSASAKVHCFDPTVTKTAGTRLDRTYTWSITKVGDQTNITLAKGETFPVNYTVTPTATSTDSNWAVGGTITVHNNAPIPATINSVSDLMTGPVTGTVSCGVTFPFVLAPSSDLLCTYTASLSDATTRTNTATAVQQNFAFDQNGAATPIGTTNYTGTATVDFTSATITNHDLCATVTDDHKGTLGVVCANQSIPPFIYQLPVGPYATCGPETFTNIATVTGNDSQSTTSASWTVNANVPCVLGCTLTIGYWKNHAGFGPQSNMIQPAWLPIWLGNQTIMCQLFGFGCNKSLGVLNNTIAVNVLSMNTYGTPSNGITKLYAQLLGADLNIKSGASSSPVSSAISTANGFLSNTDWTSWASLSKTQQQQVLSWMSTLDNYNNGLSGIPHCSQ